MLQTILEFGRPTIFYFEVYGWRSIKPFYSYSSSVSSLFPPRHLISGCKDQRVLVLSECHLESCLFPRLADEYFSGNLKPFLNFFSNFDIYKGMSVQSSPKSSLPKYEFESHQDGFCTHLWYRLYIQ